MEDKILFFRYDDSKPDKRGDKMDLSLPMACTLEGCVLGAVGDNSEDAFKRFVAIVNRAAQFKDRVSHALFVHDNPEVVEQQRKALAESQRQQQSGIIAAGKIPDGVKPPGK